MYEFTGKIIKVTPIVNVTGKFKEKCTFIVEEGTKKIAFVLFDESIYTILKPLQIGDIIKVKFSVKSLEFSGSWVTNCYVINVEKVTNSSKGNSGSKSKSYNYRSYSPPPPPPKKDAFFPAGCTKEEAKKIYRELCKKYHPDMPGGSHEKMQELNKAYDKFK
ncbi:MAG: hypothetical protein RLZZ196_2948 [Bacteroidota bacterium]|jgi:hypothetical protein